MKHVRLEIINRQKYHYNHDHKKATAAWSEIREIYPEKCSHMILMNIGAGFHTLI